MQDRLSFENTVVMTPTTYSAIIATTSTDDSDRDMQLVMHNTPIGSVEGYDITWRHISVKECSKILGLAFI